MTFPSEQEADMINSRAAFEAARAGDTLPCMVVAGFQVYLWLDPEDETMRLAVFSTEDVDRRLLGRDENGADAVPFEVTLVEETVFSGAVKVTLAREEEE